MDPTLVTTVATGGPRAGHGETVPSARRPFTPGCNQKVPYPMFVNRTNNAYVQYHVCVKLSRGPTCRVRQSRCSNRAIRLRSRRYCSDSITSTSERIDRAAIWFSVPGSFVETKTRHWVGVTRTLLLVRDRSARTGFGARV